MAERKPSDDQAAFGVYPQLKRNRSKQDREAAKNVPVDLARGFVSGVLGAPGDIESLVRMLPYLDEKTVLPKSEDIEKRLPFRSETPVSKAASGLGTLAGGFYYGPGSPLKVVGALPSALKHGAEEFAKASVAGVPHVVKPKGGNWLGGDQLTIPERDLSRLKIDTLEGGQGDTVEGLLKKKNALNKWIESNLTNYVKKDMGTPDDPVRKLAEEGIIHAPLRNNEYALEHIKRTRAAEGFPAEGMAKSDLAKQWEDLADDSIRVTKAGDIQAAGKNTENLEKARAELDAYKKQVDKDFLARMTDATGKEILKPNEVEMLLNMPFVQKAEILGDTKYTQLQNKVGDLLGQQQGFEVRAGETNPFVAKLDPETRLYAGSTYDLGFDHIIDVLKADVMAGRIRPEQLNKVSMEQAVRRTHEYNQDMAKKMAETQAKITEGMPLHKEYPEGYKWIELAKPEVASELPSTHVVEPYQSKGDLGQLYRITNPTTGMRGEGYATPERAIQEFNKSHAEEKLADALKYEGDIMGHCVGGYCPDVVAGRSRIYSLRDAKGEPHVTVEATPEKNTYLGPNGNLTDKGLQNIRQQFPESNFDTEYGAYVANSSDRNKNFAAEYAPWIKQNYPEIYEATIGAPVPQRIVQIKGKQNAKPKDDYLPFVQDFVKGGKWTDIGDFRNTGLIREGDQIMTPAEHADWLLKQLGNPPAEGMKRGGVVISKNPDTMMLDLQNKKQSGGPVKNKVNIAKNKDSMWLATQEQKLKEGGNPHSGADLLKNVLKESASNVESIARGAVSAVPGVFGDLEKLGRMGINWSFGPGGIKVGEDTILPTSADLRSYVGRLTEPTKQAEGFEELGAAANLRGQDLALRLAGKGAKGVTRAAGEELNKALMGESSIFPEGLVPQPLYAAPKGKGKAKPSETPIDRVLTPEEKAVLEKWGQKQAQEAERAKKVEKMANKAPDESSKPAKASTGKRTATPPDFYRKMAETQGDEAVLRAARAGKHLKPDTSGGYIGAPRTVDSPQALGKMRRELDQDFADSVEAVKLADPERLGTWYDRAKSGMAQMTEPYQLPRTLEQHGVYSAGVAPESELTFALKHLNSRNYGEPKMAYRGAGMRTLDRAVAADEPAEMGFKIGEYADKNDPRLPNTGLFGVNDFRRAQGMGYTDPQGNPWKAGVSDTMHPFMDLETALQVDRANKGSMGGRSDWYGPHIQELPWVYGKAQDLYSRGASKTGRYGGDQLEGIKLALQDANKTAIDYAYKHAGSATHEAIPGASTGHVPSMINAPLDERIAYGNVGRWDRPTPEAALNEFPEVGAGNRDVIYSALGHRQLPTIEASGAYLPEGASAYEMQPVKIARPLLDFPTGGEGLIAPETKQLMDFSERFRALNDAQEAFGYNLPNTMGDVTGKNAAVLDTRRLNPNRNLDPATGVPPSADQMGALTAALGDSGYGIAPTSRGATIFPFDPNATTKDINKLLKSKREELQSIYPSEMEASLNSSGYGPGVGKYTPEGFTASEPFSGQATKGLLKEASYLPQSAVQNLSESEFVRQAIKEKMRRDAALPNAREDIQNTRKFFAEADWSKAVDLIRKGMSPTAALAALGYSASSMAGEADR